MRAEIEMSGCDRQVGWSRNLGVGLLVLALASPGWAQESTEEWMRVPAADLTGLEEAVVQQLETLRDYVVDRVADRNAAAMELGDAFGELGRYYHAYDLKEPAEECYTIARRLAPRDFRWSYLPGYLFQTGGRLAEAAEQYEQALRIVPEVPPALIRLGQIYLDLNRPEDAEKVLLEALRLDSTAAAALAELGQLYLSAGRHAEAVEALERALSLEPAADLLYYPLGQAYRGLGEMEKARQALGRRGEVGVRPADPLVDGLAALTTGERVHLLRGRAAFEARRFAEAAEEFAKAVEARPDSVRARIDLAAALAEIGEVDAAISELERAVELAPGNSTAHFNLGLLHDRRGEFEKAAERYAEAVSYEPRDPEMRLRLADSLRRLGRTEDALPHYGKAIALDAAMESAWVGQAEALTRLGRFEEAVTQLETAHQLMPTSGRVAQGLAMILAACPNPSLRDGERALALALRVAKAQPTLLHVQTLAMAYAETGQCQEAAVWQSRAAEAARTAGNEAQAEILERALESYEAGPPCRPPVASSSRP